MQVNPMNRYYDKQNHIDLVKDLKNLPFTLFNLRMCSGVYNL